jgi:enediyne biosynthesis protein E4
MRAKSIGRTLPRLAAGIVVLCLSFAAIAGATTLADGTPITAEQATCWVAPPASSGTQEITFSDVTDQEGITDQVTQDRFGHGVAWGDVNNDGSLDLLLGTFANYDPLVKQGYTSGTFKPDQLAIGSPNGFTMDETFPKLNGLVTETYGWTSGLAFADLDNDGDKDLVLSRNQEEAYDQTKPGETIALRNDAGSFEIVPGAIPPNGRNNVGGRSIAVLDYNDDGLLDLFITQDRFEGGQSVLLRNQGGFQFVDATASAKLPTNIEGFGVSAKDLTGDGHGDLYVVGSNRLFIANGNGTFREIGAKAAGLVRPAPDPNRPRVDFDTGVSVGDVNRDGLPDVAVAEHYASAANKGRKIPAVSLYLNKGLNSKGNPIFQDVTPTAGLPSVASRNGDVNINDYNNDGWPDIAAGVAVSRTRPALFRSLGLINGVPRFAVPAGVGEVKDAADAGGQSHHGLPVAAADYNKDGRLDIFFDFFFNDEDGQLLLRNETSSGHWLSLSLGQSLGGGIGAKVSVYRAGGLGDPSALIGQREIAATDGYTAGVVDEAHFGLGANATVDIRVTLPPDARGLATNGVIDLTNVPADQHLRLPSGCGGS